MDVDDRVRDALPVNEPYDTPVAEAYDCWLPPEGTYDDRDLFRTVIERGNGPALELGCGNGRLLLDYRKAGVDVALHHADWASFDLPRRYATIYNPAGSFALIEDDDHARAALATWLRHLEPGGKLLVVMGIPRSDFGAQWEWKVRRSATRAADGVTFMVHEAMHCDVQAQMVHTLHRHEQWDVWGELITTFMRRHRLRWWTQNQLQELLLESGAARVRCVGADDEFVAIGDAPDV